MKDLTIPRWIKLARKLAKRERLWNKFVKFMYMGEEDEDAPQLGYDDDDLDADVGGEDCREDDDLDLDLDDEDAGDADEEWEVPQEGQWLLPTSLRED